MRRIDYVVKYDIIVKYLDKGNILSVTLCVATSYITRVSLIKHNVLN